MQTMPLLLQAIDAAPGGNFGMLVNGGIALFTTLVAFLSGLLGLRLRRSMAATKADIARMQAQVEADKIEIQRDRLLFAQQKDLYERMLRQVRVLEERLDKTEEDRADIERRYRKLEKDHRECQAGNDELRRTNEDLVRRAKKQDSRIASLEDALEAFRHQLAEATKAPSGEV
jgi:chromosome segregation ATPase